MVDLNYYMVDGANWQAVAVMACLRSRFDETDYKIEVGRFENCREQGYIFTLVNKKRYKQIVHYAFYQHRNSDQTCVKRFHGSYMNTPTIDQIPYKNKYDVTEFFSYGEILKAAEWILDDITLFIDDPYWDIFNDDEAFEITLYDNGIKEEVKYLVCRDSEKKEVIMKTYQKEYYIVDYVFNDWDKHEKIESDLQNIFDNENSRILKL